MTAARRGPRKLVLLHLSDIHLCKEEIESTQDLDADVRAKLFHDFPQCGIPGELAVDAIVVTGDLAFGGKDVEYGNARQWLKALCAKVRCPESHVWMVPGNHDKDRVIINNSAIIRDMHDAIRKAEKPALALAEHLRDNAAAHALLSPFAEYNVFAEQFQSETTSESLYWESNDEEDDLTLNDRSHLRIRGINSSIISDKTGDNGPPKGPASEVIGLMQVHLRDEEEGICYLTLCHHPPDWQLDGDVVTDHLTKRARIQLFGHKHWQRVRQVDNSIVLGAGALHPSRGEANWEPRYNILCLEVRGEAEKRKLHVEVYQRVWKSADTHFGKYVGADDAYPKTFDLSLPPWSPPQVPPVAADTAGPTQPSARAEHEKKESMISIRDLVFQFFALSYPVRMRILLDLHLIDDADTGISDSELVKRVIKRARERELLLQLEGAIRSVLKPKE